VAHPTPENVVEARGPIPVEARLSGEKSLDLGGQLGSYLFVGIEVQYPWAGTLIQRGIDLTSVSLPAFVKYLDAVALCYFDGAVGRSGVDEDDFIGPGDACERTSQVLGFIHRNDGNGEGLHNPNSHIQVRRVKVLSCLPGVMELKSGLDAGAGVEVVAHGVSDEVEGEDGQHDGSGGEKDDVGGIE